MFHNAIQNNPDPRGDQGGDYTAACPFCRRTLTDLVWVGPTGELIGCEDCAVERGLIGEPISLEEWFDPEGLHEVLRQFGLTDYQIRKPDPTPTQQPRAHYWEVTCAGSRYYLKRFYSWYPTTAVQHMHSVMSHLVKQQIPAPQWVEDAETGLTYAEAAGTAWGLYRALEGHTATTQEWMWGRPKAAEMLATLHRALENFHPEGEEFAIWGALTLDTVDRVLENWQPHPDLSPDLLGHIRERLATRYFGELYPALPKFVVHGDYLATNVLWRGDAISANVSGVLDFEKTHRDTALFDFAWGLGDRRPPLLRATIATYSRVRPLSPIEREALPEALLLGALMSIDMQMTYFRNMEEVSRLAQELMMLVRDMESLRKAAAIK